MKDKNITVVVFRKWKKAFDEDRGIVALFPEELCYEGCHHHYCQAYEHVGQHSPADYLHCLNSSTPAKPEEYKELKEELEGIGYNLKVATKRVKIK